MSDYLSRAGKTILFIGFVMGVLSIGMNLAKPKEPEIIYIQDPNYVQPPCEAQRRLKEQGFYRGKIDNIWGPESDKAYCDKCAVEAIEGE